MLMITCVGTTNESETDKSNQVTGTEGFTGHHTKFYEA